MTCQYYWIINKESDGIILYESFKESKNTGLKPSSSWSRSRCTIVFPHTMAWLRGDLRYCDGESRVSAFRHEFQCTKETQAVEEEKQAPSASGFIVVRQKEKCEKMCEISISNQLFRVLCRGHVMMMKSGWWRSAGLHHVFRNVAASMRSLWKSGKCDLSPPHQTDAAQLFITCPNVFGTRASKQLFVQWKATVHY